VLLSASVPL